jgi:hypothetical protein
LQHFYPRKVPHPVTGNTVSVKITARGPAG